MMTADVYKCFCCLVCMWLAYDRLTKIEHLFDVIKRSLLTNISIIKWYLMKSLRRIVNKERLSPRWELMPITHCRLTMAFWTPRLHDIAYMFMIAVTKSRIFKNLILNFVINFSVRIEEDTIKHAPLCYLMFLSTTIFLATFRCLFIMQHQRTIHKLENTEALHSRFILDTYRSPVVFMK